MNKSERQAVLMRVKALLAVDGLTIGKDAEVIFQKWIEGQITENQRRDMIIEVHRKIIQQQ